LLLILLLAAGVAAAYLWYSIERPFGRIPPEGVFVEIPHGTSRRAVSRILKDQGVIRSSVAFEIYSRRHINRTLVAGEYFFDHPVSGKEVFWKLAKGAVYARPFTVREGETMFDIARELELSKYMAASEFLKAAQDPSLILDLAPQAKSLEGFLFPATYNMALHTTGTDLAAMMVRKFREAMQQISSAQTNSANPGAPLLPTVTLASLVERETPNPEERPIVAGVYANRLKKGMLLQCDPTVIYALEQVGEYNGSLTLKDLRYDSPYNTYLHSGLPPGPIGNPGEASLRAACHPAQTDFLYFVSNAQGGHFFAPTLAQHNQNVLKYHRLLNGQPEEPPASVAQHAHAAGPNHKGKK
jgi:peptidoglycan lytic transglycosylase G